MPYVNVKITREGATPERKAELIRRMTDVLVDVLGMRVLHALSAIGYIFGVLLVLLAPFPGGPVDSIFGETGTLLLYSGFLIMGLSQGLVEGVINPLIATIYKEDKTHKLNVLHAWWPAGLIVGGLAGVAAGALGIGWRTQLALVIPPALVSFALILPLNPLSGGWMLPMLSFSIGGMFIQWIWKDWAKQNVESEGIRSVIMKQISGLPRLHRQPPR